MPNDPQTPAAAERQAVDAAGLAESLRSSVEAVVDTLHAINGAIYQTRLAAPIAARPKSSDPGADASERVIEETLTAHRAHYHSWLDKVLATLGKDSLAPSEKLSDIAGIVASAADPGARVDRPAQMRAICEALGFDPENHHNAAKCPYCTPQPLAPASGDAVRDTTPLGVERDCGAPIRPDWHGKADTFGAHFWNAVTARWQDTVPEPLFALAQSATPPTSIEIDYTNHRGERGVRSIIPTGRVLPGDATYHPDARWVIEALDVAKGELRTFDPAKIHQWGDKKPRPITPPAGARCSTSSTAASSRWRRPPAPAPKGRAETMADDQDFVLMRRGLYYRPNASGYTDTLDEAGRYTAAEARSHIDAEAGVVAQRASEARPYLGHDDRLKDALEALAASRQETAAALKRADIARIRDDTLEEAAAWHEAQIRGGHCGEEADEARARRRSNYHHRVSADAMRALADPAAQEEGLRHAG